jgi:rhamnosyltransferase
MRDKVTVAIPTFNADEFLRELLDSVFSQKTKRAVEVLVIDSGSNDRTLEILKDYPKVRLHQIPNSEFGHGRTRNLAGELASGEYILFLTQDAIPTHDGWLEAMVEPFELSDKVGAVFGKQVPRADCVVTLKREVYAAFRSFGPDDALVLHRKNRFTEEHNLVNTFMSDANSALRKDLLAKIPFRDIDYAEDQAMGIDLLEAGYYKAYTPVGSVYHSHNYPLRQYFRRKFDEVLGLRKNTGQILTAGYKELFLGSAKSTLRDWAFVLRDKEYSFGQKLHSFLVAPFYNFTLRLAIRAASSQKISTKMHHRLSLEARNRKR